MTTAPVPLIVGVGRSGTTLLRLMLDAHPQLAIPPEFNWFENVYGAFLDGTFDAAVVRKKIEGSQSWPDLDISSKELIHFLGQYDPENPGEFLRHIYRLYANRFGKPRYGDKTPQNLRRMLAMQALLPEAHFIHIIRDGRDVVLSRKNVWMGERSRLADLARMWRTQIEDAFKIRSEVRHYLEIRYEDLVQDPVATLHHVCDFIALDFHPEMIDFHERTASRLNELKDMQHHRAIPASERRDMFALTHSPPTVDRIGKWKTSLSASELIDIETIMAPLLRQLGYEVNCPPSALEILRRN